MVIFPGGRGDANDFKHLLKSKRPILKAYLEQGGTYLGICMGAYWADQIYFDLIGETRCVQYITRPKAEIRRSFPTVVRAEWQGQSEKFYFYDGCTFIDSDPSIETYATYANGDPMAIITGNVGLIGCHLESELGWYQSQTMRSAWHDLKHHRLLAEFVDCLLQRGQLHENNSISASINMAPLGNATIEIENLRAALQEIERETSMFTQGTFKKIHDIARRALSATPRVRVKSD